MPATAPSSHSSSSQGARPKRAANVVVSVPANRAYGFVIDSKCLRHWAKVFYENAYGDGVLSSMTPQKAAEELDSSLYATISMLPNTVYRKFPRIPRVRHRLLLMDPVYGRYLLVLKDNSSHAVLTTKIAPEDVEGVRTMVGLGDQTPKWYFITDV